MAFKIERLPLNWRDQPQLFERYWETVARQLEKTLGDILAIPAIQDAITAANDAADNANNAAAELTSSTSLSSSGVTGLTMLATDAGSSASVSVSAHTRLYGDGSSVAVSAGNVTGLSYDTVYYVYYIDAARVGGVQTFLATTDVTSASQMGDTHSLGTVKTPLAAGVDISALINLPAGVIFPIF